ncbi:MAG: hypothetical protein WCR07_12510 [Verrucomicrobiota bacterium]|jgi:hypothetical protein
MFPARKPLSAIARPMAVLLGLATALSAHALEKLPIQANPAIERSNDRKPSGAPISSVAGTPSGSDGRAPVTGEQNESGGFAEATPGQFQAWLPLGGGVLSTNWVTRSTSTLLNGGSSFATASPEMQLPTLRRGTNLVFMVRDLAVGAPYMAKLTPYSFGSVIPVPDIDESSQPLNILKERYWVAEPHTTNGHANVGYYWSPHARSVYAVQAGPVRVTWRKSQAYSAATLPAGYVNPGGGPSFATNGSTIYLLYTATYAVSGSAAKPPRTLYWTEREFRSLGRPISIPPAKVGAVNVVFNNQFPKTVSSEHRGPGYTSPADGNSNAVLQELRTVWYDQSQGFLYAFNREGRLFVELLGDFRQDGESRVSLGFEIVDVVKQPTPLDVTCDLGERLVPPGGAPLQGLIPEEVVQGPGVPFNYVHYAPGDPVSQLYAARATANPNDCLVHWMETGVQGIQWPKILGRHKLAWPADESRYSHYVRPLVLTEEQAAATAIALSPQNAPIISYQDPLDRPRAKVTPDSRFYTHLDGSQPAHRTLLRFVVNEQVAFERVFSWLEDTLRDQSFAGSVATNLTTVSNFIHLEQRQADHAAEVARLVEEYRDQQVKYQAYLAASNQFVVAFNAYLANPTGTAPVPPNLVAEPVAPELPRAPSTNLWEDVTVAPRVFNGTAVIGERLRPPAGEPGGSGAYLAGHVNVPEGNLYLPAAYIDPLVAGVAEANKGVIIPVNRLPDNHRLEVWWFRTNGPAVGHNAGNTRIGLKSIYWPAYVGRYEIAWPAAPQEIILASKVGSGSLSSREASGTIYAQNNKGLPGYNPNEEHAVMSGGMAFATRDDLNITSGAAYSSEPHVLLQYRALDERPAMRVFKVLREKPEEGIVFDYVVPAGQMIQPPPPLNFLAKPVEGDGMYAKDYNLEVRRAGADRPGGWVDGGDNGAYAHYEAFTWTDRKHNLWVYRGTHAGQPALAAGAYGKSSGTFGALPAATAVAGEAFNYFVHASRQDENLAMVAASALPGWLRIDGLALRGKPEASDVAAATPVSLKVVDLYDKSEVTVTLSLRVLATGAVVAQGRNAMTSTNPYTGSEVEFTTRPPFLAASPTAANSFTMRFYYKTEPGFDWPGVENPPEPGSIVPYLRPLDAATGAYTGDPADKRTASLDIVYRPVWPVRDPKDSSKPLPTLPFGATLAMPAFNLPGVRDMRTARVLYQQSVAANIQAPAASAVLHDATREKHSDLSASGLDRLPPSIRAESYRGNIFFPALPPHIVKRVFFQPNRGQKGALVLKGEFVRAELGENYTLLNVLRDSDLAAVKALCPASDSDNKTKWDALVDGLATDLETFVESLDTPGTYVVDEAQTTSVGVGDLAEVTHDDTAVDSYALSATGPGSGYVTLIEADGWAFTQPGDPVSMHVFKVGGSLYTGEVKVIVAENPLSELVSFQHTADLAGRSAEFEYEWKIAAPVEGLPPVADATMSGYLSLASGTDVPRKTIGGAGIQALSDNYVVMRYRPKSPGHPLLNQWSDWTAPRLAEGWIKRVLAGINPFGQRLTDLYNNAVNTDVSLLTQAGRRWEGDVALNMDTINNYGLIEIYETVLRRGRMLSIEAGFNYGPANDALLLAAGYLHDLYMILGGEAWADAANPTIGIGTKDKTYGDVATSLFAFKGQVATLAQEELALLRGRDDFLVPGVRVAPVYNRLVWNYTRGINSGEVIYALNYNIQEDANGEPNGVINAADAAKMYPQGHGDAYGHYLTSIKGYYSLIMNQYFEWSPRIEAVNVLGVPVAVDYQDERKFASGALSLARAGQQVLDLTWREAYQPSGQGWDHLANVRTNAQRTYTVPGGTGTVTRYWGVDHWASRSGQGAFINWVVGNAMILPEDTDPLHEGIQKVDRTTVTELREIASLAKSVQTSMDNAEAGVSPVGVTEGAMAFDLDPNAITGTGSSTHFEQVYQRAKVALNNAVASFDDAKDVTRLMRSEEDSLAEMRAAVAKQEMAYNNALIDLYGSPYPEDIGPGKTYPQGYAGPDLLHYAYVDVPESDFGGATTPDGDNTFVFAISSLDVRILDALSSRPGAVASELDAHYDPNKTFEFKLDKHGFFEKPEAWTGRRASPGRIQQAVSDVVKAHAELLLAARDLGYVRNDLENSIRNFKASEGVKDDIRNANLGLNVADEVLLYAQAADSIVSQIDELTEKTIESTGDVASAALPDSFIAGLAAGGDITSVGEAALKAAGFAVKSSLKVGAFVRFILLKAFESANTTARRWTEFAISDKERAEATKGALYDLLHDVWGLTDFLNGINIKLRQYDDAMLAYRRLLAEGDRILEERMVVRQRSAQVIQGFRTRDAAFRLFRTEKLERYKSMFDLAARYSLLAANAYDYETGLLGTKQGKDFKKRIIDSRALGVVRNGEPMFAGSNTGDPGISSVLAEMKADWDVLRGRLGFNNPDAYGTTASLRTELLRILPTSDGDANWRDALQASRMNNILEDTDIRRHCMQVDKGDGLPVPGIVLRFSTTIAEGYNLFGRELAGGDNQFNPASFATKIFGVGIAFVGYRGMKDPSANGGSSGSGSPSDPPSWFLDPLSLSATPYVYLVPVGVDSMRSPPLGDTSAIRSWTVDDVAIPMPFNVGGSDFSDKNLWQSSDSLTEPLFTVRKHQSFRPVSNPGLFSPALYGSTGTLLRSQFTNNRLVGRSAWNSQWKLVIPGRTLLNNPNEGLDRFMQTVRDIQVHFVTYSYSGN